MTEALRTNHNIRIVSLANTESVLCMFGEIRSDDKEKVIGYRMLYPYLLELGEDNADGTIPIKYSRWCPYSPVEEHRLGGEHIISVVFPDNNILDNYTSRLKEIGLTDEQIYFPQESPDGDSSESTATSE